MENDLGKEISEAILRYAVIENHNREMAAIPSDEELAKLYTFSKRHEARMKALFAKENYKLIRRKIFKVSRNIAAVLIIMAVVLFGALLTNSDIRAAVKQVIIEWYDKFTRFNFSDQDAVEENAEWYPSYMIEGFKETEIFFVGVVRSIEFRNQENNLITFDYGLADSVSYAIDNEHSTYETIENDGVEYHVFPAESNEYTSKIIWYDSGYAFYLNSKADLDELLKIAFSVIINN